MVYMSDERGVQLI